MEIGKSVKYMGGFIDMHPKEITGKLKDFVKEFSDNQSKVIYFDIKLKFIDKDRMTHEVLTKANANKWREYDKKVFEVATLGDFLREELRVRNITQKDLAEKLNRPIKTICEIVKGQKSITAETAIQLESALGIPAEFWLVIQSHYQLKKIKEEAQLLKFK